MGERGKGLRDKELVLFFTRGFSLAAWDMVGNIYREIEIYNHLADYFKKIYFVTYGSFKEELKYKKLLKQNIEILPKKVSFLSNKIYVFLIPFLYIRIFKKSDFLKTNQMAGAIAAVLTKLLYKKKLIVRCGYEWLRNERSKNTSRWRLKIIYVFEKIAYKCANKIIITSFDNKLFIQNNFEISPNRIKVIPNYINVGLFKPSEGVLKERNRICYVGRLVNHKNLSNLIKAFSKLPKKIIIFGGGELKQELENLAKSVKANVEFKGNISNKDLPKELNKSEVFILPSFFEGNPKTLLEAMSCGLPCIGTNVEGIKEIVKHKENGYLCKTNAESIREAILEVLGDKSLKEKIGANARKTILEKFSLEEILEKEIRVYEAL